MYLSTRELGLVVVLRSAVYLHGAKTCLWLSTSERQPFTDGSHVSVKC